MGENFNLGPLSIKLDTNLENFSLPNLNVKTEPQQNENNPAISRRLKRNRNSKL